MKKYGILFILIASALIAQEMTPKFDDFKVIYEKNIFSKTRKPINPDAKNRDVEKVLINRVISLYVLKGIAFSGNQGTAFIENEIGNVIYRLGSGDTVANGIIVEVKNSSILYSLNEQVREVKIGGELGRSESEEYESVGGQAGYSVQSPTVPSGEAPEKPVSGDSQSEILRKMMERRKGQIGK